MKNSLQTDSCPEGGFGMGRAGQRLNYLTALLFLLEIVEKGGVKSSTIQLLLADLGEELGLIAHQSGRVGTLSKEQVERLRGQLVLCKSLTLSEVLSKMEAAEEPLLCYA